MIKERVLIVEDNRTLAIDLQEQIVQAGDEATEVSIAGSYKEAVDIASKGDLAYCVLDLGIPESPGGNPVEITSDGVCRLGFELLEFVCRLNPFADVTIASRFADDRRVSAVRDRLYLERRLPIKGVFNKNVDDDFDRHISHDLRGLQSLNDHLRQRGLVVVHPLERRILRRLWEQALLETQEWPTPIIMLRGRTGAGKSRWAVEFPELVDHLRQNTERVRPVQFDCGELSSPQESDSPQISLFGARNYQGKRPSAGVFEQATRYRNVLPPNLATPTSQVDYSGSSTAILHEFGNLPVECQRLLLTVLDPNRHVGGRVTPAGGGNRPIPVGCSVVLTTNADIESRVVKSDNVGVGQLGEDLFRRLARDPRDWILVPSLADLGWDCLLQHLRTQLARRGCEEVVIAENAESLLKEALEKHGASMSYDITEKIAVAYAAKPGKRLRHDHVQVGIGHLLIRKSNGSQAGHTAKPIAVAVRICGLDHPADASAFVVACALKQLEDVMMAGGLAEVFVSKRDLQNKHEQKKPGFTWSRVQNIFGPKGQSGLQHLARKLEEHGYEIQIEKKGLVAKIRKGWALPSA